MQNIRPAVSEIRSIGLSKVNRLVRAAAQIDALRPAFADWQAGEIYICSKKGDYRYRFGEQSKKTTPWSAVAQSIFATPAEFALAAVVLGPLAEQARDKAVAARQAAAPAPMPATVVTNRVDIVNLAVEAAA